MAQNSGASAPMETLEIVEPSQPATASANDIEYPGNPTLTLTLLGLALSLVMGGIDNGILATAVPSITDYFHTITDIGWYSSSFLLASCAFLFMWGKMYKLFPVKRIYLVCLIIFAIGNVICGSAPSSKAVVLGRAICGFANGGIITGVFTIMMQSIPLRHRPAVGAIGGMLETVAATAAPLLGGIITERISWRFCFYVNLPICGLTFATMLFCYKGPPAAVREAQVQALAGLTWRQKVAKLDLVGTALFVPGITCLLLALQWGGTTYGWGNARIIVLLVVFGVLIAAFGYLQHRLQEDAVLVPRIVKNRSIIGAMLFGACVQASLTVIDYYMPIWFQSVKQKTPAESGVLILPIVIGLAISCLLGGVLTSAVGFYTPFMLTTSILLPVATGLLTTLHVNAESWRVILFQALFGFAAGIGVQGPQSAASTVLSPEDGSLGIAAVMFTWTLGPALAITAAQSVFTSRLTTDIGIYAPGVSAKVLETVGLSGLAQVVGTNGTKLAEVLVSYDEAITQTFYLPVALACMSLMGAGMMEWKSVKEKTS